VSSADYALVFRAAAVELQRRLSGPAGVVVPGPELQPKQARASLLANVADELLYGGSAGGGKSVWLRNYAIRFALEHDGAYIGLLRRDLQRLKKTHARPLTLLLRGIAVLNRSDWTWTFPNGSVLQFVGLQYEGDELNYNSTEFDLLCWDDLTEFSLSQYTYMLSRLRSTRGHRPRSVAATNPIGTGYSWVKRYWVKPKPADMALGQALPQPYQMWSPPLPDSPEAATGPSRAFVPATVYDNPALLASNPGYIVRLRAEPDARKRRALLDGDWDAMDQVPGALFSSQQIEADRIRLAPLRPGQTALARLVEAIGALGLLTVAVAIDPAGTAGPTSDETGIVAAGLDAHGHGYVLADRSGRYASASWVRAAIQLYLDLSANVIVIERNAGAGQDSMFANIRTEIAAMRREGLLDHEPLVVSVWASRGKATRAEPIAGLYMQHVVHHVGDLTDLEDELTTWLPASGYSPGRLDSAVWALTHLSTPEPDNTWSVYE